MRIVALVFPTPGEHDRVGSLRTKQLEAGRLLIAAIRRREIRQMLADPVQHGLIWASVKKLTKTPEHLFQCLKAQWTRLPGRGHSQSL